MPAFMLSIAACSSSPSAIVEHAGMACQAKAPFSALHTSAHLLKFGVSASMRHATGRVAQSQSGCLPVSSLLSTALHQSAMRHRLVACRPAAASSTSLLGIKLPPFPGGLSLRQPCGNGAHRHAYSRVAESLQTSSWHAEAVVQQSNIAQGIEVCMSDSASFNVGQPSAGSRHFASAPSLTGWSRGRLLNPALRPGQVGAPYRGR